MDKVILELERIVKNNPGLNYAIEGSSTYTEVRINQGFMPKVRTKITKPEELDYLLRKLKRC